MQDLNATPLSIAREVKALIQCLKESLVKLDPWEREIEFQRSNLRRQLLQLIFVHPYARESKEADHSLWMATSYFLISSYKSRIAASDGALHQTTDHPHRGNRSETNGHHIHKVNFVEYRKLVHRFRQFLAEEEKFWTNFVLRIVRAFDLQNSRPVLATLGLTIGSDNVPDTSPTRNGRRNLFPNEDVTELPSPNQKEQKLVMLCKALVCLGDIARYREHYNEGGGRPRAGKDFHDDSKPSRGKGGRRGAIEQLPRPRNYSRAQDCYERARLLVPDVGNASHQLAILASYQQDPFGGVFQYYRAMCVKLPYETAASNLDSTLSRNLDIYKNNVAKIDSVDLEQQSPKERVDRFKKAIVVLHALWRLDPVDADKRLPGHEDAIIATFSTLTSDRILPTDIIWKTLLMAFGALWRYRMLRDPNAERDSQGELTNEFRIFSHIVHLMHALFQIGIIQLSDTANSPEPAINGAIHSVENQPDLAQNITAVFRRTLPALRMGFKWFNTHLNYVSDAMIRFGKYPDMNVEILMSNFWSAHNGFVSLLGRVFPSERLPKMEVALEEDIEISGFAPLKKAMLDATSTTSTGVDLTQNQMHPNEEQLMRIADLLLDAEKLRRLREETLPTVQKPIIPAHEEKPQASDTMQFDHEEPRGEVLTRTDQAFDMDDDGATVSTRTDDDPVNLVNIAMKAILSSDDGDDDEEEQVLYPKQNMNYASLPSINQPSVPAVASPVMVQSNTNQQSLPAVSATPIQKRVSLSKPITAEDLVNEMMRPRAAPEPTALPRTFGPGSPLLGTTTPLLFGSGSPTSIWSTTPHDSAALSANNLRRTGYPGAQTRVSPPSSMAGFASASNLQNAVASSTRGGFAHQRQLSQPLYGPVGSPVQGTQGGWAVPQDSTQSSMLSQFSSQPQRHTLSPIISPSFGPPNGGLNHTSYPVHSPSLMNNLGSLSDISPHPLSPFRQTVNDNTWSYTGLESLSGIGSSLMPFTHGQTRPPPMQRSGGWT